MAPPATADAAVGWRVQVFWEGENAWFDGTIAKYTPDDGFFVRYDDGEEQWEDASGDTLIKFTAPPLETKQSQRVWSQQPPPSSVYTDAADDYADDDYDDGNDNSEDEGDRDDGRAHHEDVAVAAISQKSPTPELDNDNEDDEDRDSKALQLSRHTSVGTTSPPDQQRRQKQQQARAAALSANSATVFFRDDETLREMRQALQLEKKTLVHEHATLVRQLDSKQQCNASLKRELEELKTCVTLASVLGHGCTAGEPAPRTPADWSERVLDQKLQNKQIIQELAELRACGQQRAHELEQRERQCEQLREKLAHVPRRDLCSLVDIQVEIAAVLDEKRLLTQVAKQQQQRTSQSSKRASITATTGPSDGSFGWPSDSDAIKVALEKELGKLELACSRARDECHAWRLRFERENARILPLQARRIKLQQALAPFETSRVLLRSAFLRLRPDASGRVPVPTAAHALLALAPAHTQFADADAILAALVAQRVVLEDAPPQSQTLAFADFAAGFERLFQL